MGARIIPPQLSFRQALQLGYTGRIEHQPYLDWLKTLGCWQCGAKPVDPSHLNSLKGGGTKSTDWLALPECRAHHDAYEKAGKPQSEERIYEAAFYLLQAIYEGRLVWAKSAHPIRSTGT